MAAPKRPLEQPKVVKIQVPENVAEYYTNNFNMGFTGVDFVLFFGSLGVPNQLVTSETSLSGTIKVDVIIRMSPQHVKQVVRAMKENVGEYENRYGEIADIVQKEKPGDSNANASK